MFMDVYGCLWLFMDVCSSCTCFAAAFLCIMPAFLPSHAFRFQDPGDLVKLRLQRPNADLDSEVSDTQAQKVLQL